MPWIRASDASAGHGNSKSPELNQDRACLHGWDWFSGPHSLIFLVFPFRPPVLSPGPPLELALLTSLPLTLVCFLCTDTWTLYLLGIASLAGGTLRRLCPSLFSLVSPQLLVRIPFHLLHPRALLDSGTAVIPQLLFPF